MFLQHDLKPDLIDNGIVPIYVDLWENRSEDPGELIARVIGRSLVLDFDPAHVGKPGGVSIPEALRKIPECVRASCAKRERPRRSVILMSRMPVTTVNKTVNVSM